MSKTYTLRTRKALDGKVKAQRFDSMDQALSALHDAATSGIYWGAVFTMNAGTIIAQHDGREEA